MPGFSWYLQRNADEISVLRGMNGPARSLESVLAAARKGGGLEAEEVASLLAWGRDPERRAEIHAAANRVRDRWAPKTVEFIIPVYLTSFCQNECLYCGYRQSNPLAERVRLSLEDYGRQLDLILSWGHRQIELVLSDDPEFGPEVLARYVEFTRGKLNAVGGGVIALCSPVYEQADYARLRAAGLDWVAEWQETYHQPHFDRWHVAGSRKRQFESRLEIWDRVIAAGISKVALGVLLGLYEWRFDVLAAVEHGNYLRKTYGLEPHALGIPRLKPARGVLASQKPSRFTVSDEDFRLVVSVYHLAFPRSRVFFNTREDYEFNWSMLAAGDLFTVDCETLPGGYLRPRLPGQFSTHVYPPRRDVALALMRRGFSPQYLAEETAPPQAEPPPLTGARMNKKRWAQEHAEIRDRLDDWQMILSWLAIHHGEQLTERQAAGAALRMVLHFFRTFAIEHGRNEETDFLQALGEHPDGLSRLERFRRDHERLGVDLDVFQRQLVSYGLSGDPSVLLTLGDRIIRELREHLNAEDEFLKNVPDAEAAATA